MCGRYIKNLSIKLKTLAVLFSAIVVVFFLTLAASFRPYRVYNEQLYASGVQTLSIFAKTLEDRLDSYTDFTFRVLSDNVVQTNLSAMSKYTVGRTAWLNANDILAHQFYSFSNSLEHAASLQLISSQGRRWATYWGTSAVTATQLAEWVEASHQASGSPKWFTMPSPTSRLILLRDIREAKELTFDTLGTICLEIDLAKLVSAHLKQMEKLDCPLSIAIFEEGTCLYATDEITDTLSLTEDGYQMMDTPQGKMFFMRYTSSQGWVFLMARPFEPVLLQIRHSVLRAIHSSLFAAIGALVLGWLLISRMLKHLQVLLRKIDRFSRGELPERAEMLPYQDRTDEFGRLHRHFDRMITEYDHIVRDNYEKQLAIKDAQARQLRAQIRPHFLYNTLQTIYLMAQEAHQAQIAEMTDALGKLMHASINERKDVITIREDWQIAKEYLRIQETRYQNRLTVQYELPESLENNQIPSMTIQPLVENAVHYAAEEMLEVCCIRVWGQENADSVDICVEDNGPGMVEDILERLNRGEIQPDGLGIGLTNIHRRIQLEFTQEYGLRIRRQNGKTQVIIHLPKTGGGQAI